MLSAEYELVLASLQPHGEHHLLEITNDSELVSPEFGQDCLYHFEAVCPSQLFWEFLYPQRGWSLSSERFYVWIMRLHPYEHCRLNQDWTPDSREASLRSCQWSLRFSGKIKLKKKKKKTKKKETQLRAESSQWTWLGADFISTLPAASLLNFSLDSMRAEFFPKSPITWANQEGSVYFSIKRMPPRSTTLFSSSFRLKSSVHRHLLAYHPNKNLTTSPGNSSHIGQLHFFEGSFWFCIKKFCHSGLL